MKREIKFRGKNASNGEWIYGNLMVDYPTLFCEDMYIGCIIAPFTEPNYGYHIRCSTVGQFTGLKDKSGNEVYEGDILFLPKTADNNDEYYTVVYRDDSFLAIEKYNDTEIIGWLKIKLQKGAYVIGNIHDNPELMEE